MFGLVMNRRRPGGYGIMRDLLERLKKSESYRLILDDLRTERRASADELWGSAAAMLVSALAELTA